MDSTVSTNIRTNLTRWLQRFEASTPNQNTRNYFQIYITGIIDETGFVKKSTKTPGVQRQ